MQVKMKVRGAHGAVDAERVEREEEEERPERRERQAREHLGVHGEHEARPALHDALEGRAQPGRQMAGHRERHEAAEHRAARVYQREHHRVAARSTSVSSSVRKQVVVNA